jgi:regulator of sirC expression with transglutaminase-like and TPR domain
MTSATLAGRTLLEQTLHVTGEMKDDEIDLANVALVLAALDQPEIDLAPYRAHLNDLAHDVGAKIPGGAEHNVMRRARALADVISHEHGYAGDETSYDDPKNADLMQVIDRRKGLPVALAILYLDIARRLGWEATGINFPSHFLIRLGLGAMRIIVDPFHGGAERSVADLRALLKQVAGLDAELEPAHYAPIGKRDTLIRLLNNIKIRALADGDVARGAEIIDRMMMIAPGAAFLLFEAGACHAKTGNLIRAGKALEAFLASGPVAAARGEAEALLRQVRQQLN